MYLCGMKPQRYIFFELFSLALLTGCDLFESHPYDGKIEGETHLTAKNLDKLKKLHLGEEFKFAFISDTQRDYDSTDDAVADINRRSDIDFVIHGGDLTDFGLTKEFEWMRDCLLAINKPWVCIIGNHDYLGHGEHIYEEMFGDLNYAFTVGHVRFEFINTIALELDYTTPIPDFNFLEKEINYLEQTNHLYPDSITQTIFVMHSRPGDEQFNNNVNLPFDRYLQLFPGMDSTLLKQTGKNHLPSFCLNGHNHHTEMLDIFDDYIIFYGISNIAKRQYYIISIKDNDYEIETIDF